MHARHRAAILLGVFALLAFLVRWPMDSYTCNVNTWKSSDGKPWRASKAEGESFFTNVFRGGSGTPAIFAMLGGQRYMVANITWSYADVLFHKGKIYDMIYPYEATVSLNPAFTEAWSTYGWHLAWNLYSDTNDIIEKKKWMRLGTDIYIRAIVANPDKPTHRADLARVYMEREGNFRKALNVMEPVVFETTGVPHYGPLTNELKNETTNVNVICGRHWDPYNDGHRLAIVYRKLGIYTGDWKYLQKAIDVYNICLKADPNQKGTAGFIKDLEGKVEQLKKNDTSWLENARKTEAQLRKNYLLPTVRFGDPIEKLWPDKTLEDGSVVRGGDTGIPNDHLLH